MNYEFNLDITPGGMPPILHMSQYDTFRTFTANLKQDGGDFTPGLGATAKVKGFNGKVAFEIDCTISGSAVTFQLTAASTDQFGIFPVTIEMTIGSNTLSPLCMIFDVQRAGYTNEQAASSPEFENAMQEAAQKYVLGMDAAARTALLDLLAYAAYTGPDARAKYDTLETALQGKLSYIVADYAQDRTIYDTDSLDILKEGDDLIVTAYYTDGTHSDIEDSQYTLSGTLTAGTSEITVTYLGKTDTFDVTVTAIPYKLTSGTHTFTTQTAAKYVTISNGNHIKVGFPNVSSGTNAGAFINLSDLTKNQSNAKQDINNVAVNNLSDVYFTIPNGAVVKWEIKNISHSIADMLNNSGELNLGMRKTSASSGVIDPVGYPSHAERLSVEKTFTEATNVSCVFLYAVYTKAVDVEFDLYLTVNGERWI